VPLRLCVADVVRLVHDYEIELRRGIEIQQALLLSLAVQEFVCEQ
jgi:hypothetical protein